MSSSPQPDVAHQVQALLRAQEMAGERLVNRIRFAYGLAGLAMVVAATDINTPEANRIFLVQGAMLLACCAIVWAWFRLRQDEYTPLLKYATITFDIGVVHLSVFAADANYSGIIEYFHSFFPLILILWNLLSGLRYSARACLWSASVTAAISSALLAWVVLTGRIEVSDTSVWGANAINIADESMRIVFVSASGLVAAVLARIARSLIERAELEAHNRATLERHKARLSKYLGGELAEVVVADGSAFELGGSRRRATILFTDIRNFTGLSECTQPEDVVNVLNAYFKDMVDIVFRYGGTLDKFLGDGLMAVYGAPFDRNLAPLRAVLTALDMVEAVDRLNQRLGTEPPLRIGAGVATGDVIAGNIGSLERMEYTVIGDSVNLAARLEALNRDMGTQIVVGPVTWEAIKDLLPCKALPPLKIRGLTGEQQLYTIDPAAVSAEQRSSLRARFSTGAELPTATEAHVH